MLIIENITENIELNYNFDTSPPIAMKLLYYEIIWI